MAEFVKREFVPASPPPPGVESNPEHPDYIGTRMIVISSICVALILICTGLRLYTRIKITKAFGIDDVVLILADISAITLVGTAIKMTQYGLGNHVWDIPLTTLSPTWLVWDFVSSVVYTVAIWLAKLAVLMLYLRLFPDKFTRAVLYFMTFWITGQVIGVTVALFLNCTPFAKIWDVTITTGWCLNKNAISISTSGLNVATDFILLLLPLPTVWRLNLPQQQKIALFGVFLLGAFVCAVSVVRLAELNSLLADPDFTWSVSDTFIWSNLEISVSIICSCLIVLQPLLRRFGGKFFSVGNSFGSLGLKSSSSREKRRPRRFESYILASENDAAVNPATLELGNGPSAGEDKGQAEAMARPSTQDARDKSTEHIFTPA